MSYSSIAKAVLLESWLKEYEKITSKYVSDINWETVVWNEGEIEQAADDLQLEAYRNVYTGDDCNPSISDWCCYDESCEARTDFQYKLYEKLEEVRA